MDSRLDMMECLKHYGCMYIPKKKKCKKAKWLSEEALKIAEKEEQ